MIVLYRCGLRPQLAVNLCSARLTTLADVIISYSLHYGRSLEGNPTETGLP